MTDPNRTSGIALALGAYVIWGLFPLFWKLLVEVPALEVLAHRVLWALPLAALVVALQRNWRPVLASLRDRRQLQLLAATTVLIAFNWGLYIWAVNHDRVVQASQGYYLTPLLNVLFGLLLFGERLRRWQWAAVGLAAAGVAVQIGASGTVPWVGLGVGISFAAYGALRKRAVSDSVSGLFVETLLLFPLALGWVLWLEWQGVGAFARRGPDIDALLVMAGVLTATPLLLFVAATRRLPMATVGLIFYLTPTLQFLIGSLVFEEPVGAAALASFGLIWTGLAVFTFEGRWNARRGLAIEPG